MSDNYIYLDGKFVKSAEAKISVFDHGLLYGDGVFEGIRAYNGRVFKLKEHIDRMYDAAKAIMLDIPVSKQEMEQIVIDSCAKNKLKDAYIRLIVTRGVGDLGLDPRRCPKPSIISIAASIQLYDPELYEKGLKIITAVQRRNKPSTIDPQIKSLNYLNNILAKIEANNAGAPEAIILDHDGVVAECTGDNIYIIKNGTVYTPPIYVGALDGITRATIIEICQELNIPIFEKEFTLFNVYAADECFLTGTGAEAIPVTSVDNRVIGEGKGGEITKKILDAYQKRVRSEGAVIGD